LTPNFSLAEFLYSDTAKARRIDNQPNSDELKNIKFVAVQLEILRVLVGNKPIKLTSGFRSAELNKAVKGSNSSDHRSGLAVDLKVAGLSGRALGEKIVRSHLRFDQIIDYRTARIHLGFGPRFRGETLEFSGGRYKPVSFI